MRERFEQEPRIYRNASDDYVQLAFIAGAEWADAFPANEDPEHYRVTCYELQAQLAVALEALNKIKHMSDDMDNGCYAIGKYHEKVATECLEAIEKIKGTKDE